MSDVSLKIVADGGGAVAEFDKIAQAQERMADAAKHGGVAYAEQAKVMDQSMKLQLAQLEQRFAREKAHAEQHGRKIGDITEKYERDKLRVIDKSERAKLDLLRRSSQEAARNLDKGTDAVESQSMAFDGLTTKLAGTVAGFLSVSSVVSAVSKAFDEYAQKLESVAAKQSASMGGAMGLAMLSAPGEAGKDLKASAALGAQFGFQMDQAHEFMTAAKSAFPNAPEEAAVATMEVARLGLDPAVARGNLRIAKRLGMAPATLNANLLGVGSTSDLTEAELSRAIPEVPLYEFGGKYDTDFAFSVMNALGGGVETAAQLPTAMKGVAVALTRPNALTKNIKGFSDMSGPERLEAIGRYVQGKEGSTSFEAIQRAGLTDVEASMGLGILLSGTGWQTYTSTLAEAPTFADRFNAGAVFEQKIKEDIGLRKQAVDAEVAAAAAFNARYGPQSEEAMLKDIQEKQLGVTNQFGMGVDDSTGGFSKPGFFRRAQSYLDFVGWPTLTGETPDRAKGLAEIKSYWGIAPAPTETSPNTAMDELTKTLREHMGVLTEDVKVTRDLIAVTANTGTQTPTPAPRNRNNE